MKEKHLKDLKMSENDNDSNSSVQILGKENRISTIKMSVRVNKIKVS